MLYNIFLLFSCVILSIRLFVSHTSSLHLELLSLQQNCKRYLAGSGSGLRKLKFLNNSVIYEDIELKIGMITNFGSLISKSDIKLQL